MSDENRDPAGRFAEPAFGQQALERDAGYTPMDDARKKESTEELSTREAAEERAKSAEPGESVERGYFDNGPKEATTLERAAADLAEMRNSEADSREEAENERIRKEVDALRGDDEPPEPKVEKKEDAPEPQAAANEDDFDAELERTLNNPRIKDAIASQISENESARQVHAEALLQASVIAEQALVSQFPEFVNASPDQCLQILSNMAQQNPGRFAAFQAIATNAKSLIQHHQALQGQSAEQGRQAFRSYATEQDALFEKSNPFNDMPASSRHQIADTIIEGFKEYGIDARDYERLYQNDRTLRHAGFQRMMVDAAKYRLMQKSAKAAKTAAVPPVQRPGSRAAASRDDRGMRSAADAFRSDPNIKNAAAILAARRNSRN